MKSYKTIGIIVFLILAFAVFAWIAKPSPNGNKPGEPAQTSSATPGDLTAESAQFDFGTVSMAAGKVTHEFAIKNTSAGAVTITTIETSCMCTVATLIHGNNRFGPFGMPGHGLARGIDEIINPGETAVVEAVFDPAAHGPAGVGKIDREIHITDASSKMLVLRFSAFVTP